MGYEKTEPKNDIILLSAVGTAAILVLLVPSFHTYFNTMTEGELSEKVWAPDMDEDGVVDYVADRDARIEATRAAIAAGDTSIEDAIGQLATQGRNVGRVRPVANDGLNVAPADAEATLAAVRGWDQLADEEAQAAAAAALGQRRARAEEAERMREAAAATAELNSAGVEIPEGANVVELLQQVRAAAAALRD